MLNTNENESDSAHRTGFNGGDGGQHMCWRCAARRAIESSLLVGLTSLAHDLLGKDEFVRSWTVMMNRADASWMLTVATRISRCAVMIADVADALDPRNGESN